MPVVVEGKVVLGLVRGDDRLDEGKMTEALGGAFRPATEDEIRETFGADPGSIGPVGVSVEVVADEALREGQFVAGANETGHHLRGVQAGRDFEPRFANIREVREATPARVAEAHSRLQTAIEVGHIFKLGTRYSEPLEATFLDEDGTEKPWSWAATESARPARWLRSSSSTTTNKASCGRVRWRPYDVHLIALPGLEDQAAEVAANLEAAGDDVLLDDRDSAPARSSRTPT